MEPLNQQPQKKLSQNGKTKTKIDKKGLLIARDPVYKKDLAGAVVKKEDEKDTAFFLKALIDWLKPFGINYITIDFSERLEAGVKRFFTDEQILKGTFHASQLLTNGISKELIRLKNKKYVNRIKEFSYIRHFSLNLEEDNVVIKNINFQFHEPKIAWEIYLKLRSIFSAHDLRKIEVDLRRFLNSTKMEQWKGGEDFKERCKRFFPKRGLTQKGVIHFKRSVYRAWRGVIRRFRMDIEKQKSGFNDARFIVLKNPLTMKDYEIKKLRKSLKRFPWLRPIRQILVKYYYQFRVAPVKRVPLKFLLCLVSKDSHPKLKSAINTLLKYEKQIFRFQVIQQENPKLKDCKGIKVVNETSMRKVNRLFQTQMGMRTLDNLVMRTSHYLDCPIIVAPSVLE